MNTLDSKNPNFSGKKPEMRKNTVCFIDEDGWLCYIPFGTMTWIFETKITETSFPKWFNQLQAKELT